LSATIFQLLSVCIFHANVIIKANFRCDHPFSFAADFLVVGTWLSLVEHSLGVRGVGSSNLPVPTIFYAKLRISGSGRTLLLPIHEAPQKRIAPERSAGARTKACEGSVTKWRRQFKSARPDQFLRKVKGFLAAAEQSHNPAAIDFSRNTGPIRLQRT
jgi:hypothetical protein